MSLLRKLAILAIAATAMPTVVVLTASQAQAQDPAKVAEKLRLEEEMKKLAQRNAWTGVERKYKELIRLKIDLPVEDYKLGAEAARQIGKTMEWYNRLLAAKDIAPNPELFQSLESIDQQYGRVDIVGHDKRRPELSPAVMPFVPDQRKGIEWGQTVMAETGSFKGLLPVGDYKVGSLEFTVGPGPDFQLIQLTKEKGKAVKGEDGKKVTDSGTVVQGTIEYQGLVATLGYNYMFTAMPGEPVENDGVHMAQPGSVNGSGLGLDIGYELGFSKTFGLAITAGYTGLYSGRTQDPTVESDTKNVSTYHNIHGWLAAAIRPGKLRIAVGPTYTYHYGIGTGVAEWYDIGQDPDRFPSEDIQWKGYSFTPGASASVGYGVLDLGSLRGVIEADFGWSFDGDRHYTGFGVRVGIVPKIDRFKG